MHNAWHVVKGIQRRERTSSPWATTLPNRTCEAWRLGQCRGGARRSRTDDRAHRTGSRAVRRHCTTNFYGSTTNHSEPALQHLRRCCAPAPRETHLSFSYVRPLRRSRYVQVHVLQYRRCTMMILYDMMCQCMQSTCAAYPAAVGPTGWLGLAAPRRAAPHVTGTTP